MIKFADAHFFELLEYLNEKYPCEQDVYVSILYTYDMLDIESKQAFAVYIPNPDKPVIMIAGETPEVPDLDEKTFVVESIAHEYMHHIQYCEGRLQENESEETEKEAEEFAKKISREFNR